MLIRAKLSALKQTVWWEYLIRFVLGGLATFLTGVIARAYGPLVGGLFLAFPAIFCASATLVERHERQRKERRGLQGSRRGQQAAALEAVGASLGSLGLIAFGAAIWLLAPGWPIGAFLFAGAAWFLVAVATWRLRREMRSTRRHPAQPRRSAPLDRKPAL